MYSWFLIDSQPRIGFYTSHDDFKYMPSLSYRRLVKVGTRRLKTKVGGGSENDNVPVVLDNSDGGLIEVFRVPPLRFRGVVYRSVKDGKIKVFSGTIVSIQVNDMITLNLET